MFHVINGLAHFYNHLNQKRRPGSSRAAEGPRGYRGVGAQVGLERYEAAFRDKKGHSCNIAGVVAARFPCLIRESSTKAIVLPFSYNQNEISAINQKELLFSIMG
jgi:hypothetical protein